MIVVREVFHCKPGKVRPLVEKFKSMSKLMEKGGGGKMRLLTDVSGSRYWTLVAEMEVESLGKFEAMMAGEGMSDADNKQFEDLMKGYHELVETGHREFFKLEA
jgi:hypothetical protein